MEEEKEDSNSIFNDIDKIGVLKKNQTSMGHRIETLNECIILLCLQMSFGSQKKFMYISKDACFC